MLKLRISVCSLLMLSILPSVAFRAAADGLAVPRNNVILTVTGNIDHTNNGAIAEFDLDMIAAMSDATIVTETPWTNGVREFRGVFLRDLLEKVGARGKMLRARALNDYSVDIPITDIISHDVLMAVAVDGEFMAVRENGPLWIIYPWSQNPGLDTLEIKQRSIWQLRELNVR